MKLILAIMILIVLCTPCIGGERDNSSAEGPILLASDKTYSIHAFQGQVQEPRGSWNPNMIKPGIILFHVDYNTRKTSWLLKSGTFINPTVRMTYSIIRLLGLYQTDSQIATVLFNTRRFFDRSPDEPPSPDKGVYHIAVFEKKTGKQLFDIGIDNSTSLPRTVPEETIKLGIIEKTKIGFNVFGQPFSVNNDGKIDVILPYRIHK